MERIIWMFSALAAIAVLSGCGAGVKIATKEGAPHLPYGEYHEAEMEFRNPYEHTLLITDITPAGVLFPADIIVPPTGKTAVRMKVFLGRVYTISGHAVRGSEIVRFHTRFSTAELKLDSTGVLQGGPIVLRLSNEQKGVVVNNSGRTIVMMTIDAQRSVGPHRDIYPNDTVEVMAYPPGFNIIVYFQDEGRKNYYRMRRIPVIVNEGQKLVDFRGEPVSIIVGITPEDYKHGRRVQKDTVGF